MLELLIVCIFIKLKLKSKINMSVDSVVRHLVLKDRIASEIARSPTR